ncbi:MAG: hypothetical protein K2Y14_12015 [Burkholderiales bacterium]|nr:hypothetical protein [Burkholderiales bacterium]
MKRLLLIISIFIAALLSACNGGSSSTPPVSLQSITVTSNDNVTVLGVRQAFVATAHYSDGSDAIVTNSAIWSSSNPEIATVSTIATKTGVKQVNALNAGIATPVAVGQTNISASLNGVSGTALLVVSPAVLVSINPVTAPSLSTPKGVTQQFTAI